MEREARAWSMEQVAKQLNLAPRQIQALESDNYAVLPGMASVRGFIRAYAKLLKIDAASLMDMMPVEASTSVDALVRHQLSTPFVDSHRLPVMGDGRIFSKWFVAGMIAIVLTIAVFAGYQMGWIRSLLPDLLSTANEPKTVSMAGLSSATIPPVPLHATSVTGPSTRAATVDSVGIPHETPNAEPSGDLETAVTANAIPSAADVRTASAAAPVAGKNSLVLKMREDSWIEIRRTSDRASGSGRVLLARLAKAGSSETFEVTEPVLLIVGNAAGVDATLRGTPIKLSSQGRSNVAHLDLK
jgi:cytoskeleton protein RodZ